MLPGIGHDLFNLIIQIIPLIFQFVGKIAFILDLTPYQKCEECQRRSEGQYTIGIWSSFHAKFHGSGCWPGTCLSGKSPQVTPSLFVLRFTTLCPHFAEYVEMWLHLGLCLYCDLQHFGLNSAKYVGIVFTLGPLFVLRFTTLWSSFREVCLTCDYTWDSVCIAIYNTWSSFPRSMFELWLHLGLCLYCDLQHFGLHFAKYVEV